jgi:cobalt-precorrin 5A hydrolase
LTNKDLAIYALTEPGQIVAETIVGSLKADLYLPERLFKQRQDGKKIFAFDSLGECLTLNFNRYRGHIFIAATGLVVRLIAPLLIDKKTDPAVVCLGQDGRFVISLVSGHLGGANQLAKEIAAITKGQAVITTATDLTHKPALEVIAREHNLTITNFECLPALSRNLAEGKSLPLYDPGNFLYPHLHPWADSFRLKPQSSPEFGQTPAVVVDYHQSFCPKEALIMRPPALTLGLGCHRGINLEEVLSLLDKILENFDLARESITHIASVTTRSTEPALIELSQKWKKPIVFFSKEELGTIQTPNPSETVLKRIGVPSVCEAAAILAAKKGQLIVSKQKNERVTCALALIDSTL